MRSTLFDGMLSESQRNMVARANDFAKAEIAPYVKAWEAEKLFDRALYDKAAAAGLLGVSCPVAYGGGGLDLMHEVLLTEALVHTGACPSVVVGLGTLALAAPPILTLGDEAQKQRFLSPLTAGRKVAALALTEPGGGSDLASLETRAHRVDDHYVLNGAKRFISSGVRADTVVVLARTGEDLRRGLTFFVVERGMPGFSVQKKLDTSGWRASDTAELRFENVKLSAEQRLGAEGSGMLCLMRNIHTERILIAAQGQAIAERAFDEAVVYAQQREAFGQKVASFQTTRHKLSKMATKIQSLKALTYQVSRRVMAGAWVSGEVAMVKNLAAEVARDVCWEAVQIHGGAGCLEDSVVSRLARDARILAIGGGTVEMMHEVVADSLGI